MSGLGCAISNNWRTGALTTEPIEQDEWLSAAMTEFLCPESPRIVLLEVQEAWDTLSETEQRYAHWFARACWAGTAIIAQQTSPESASLLELLKTIHRTLPFSELQSACTLTDTEFCAFIDYSVMVFSNIGNVDHRDTKFIPSISPDTFRKIATAAQCLAAFEPLAEVLYSVHSGVRLGWDWSCYYLQDTATSATPDEGAVAKITAACEQAGLELWNTRLEQLSPDEFRLLVASASTSRVGCTSLVTAGEGASAPLNLRIQCGDHAEPLTQAIHCLQQALPYAANPEQQRYIEQTINYLQTGSIPAHKEAMKDWVSDLGPAVETMIGFIENYRDPAGIRSEFEGFVAVVNKTLSGRFGALVAFSEELLQRLPWGEAFESDVFVRPDFTSLDVLCFNSGSLPLGICLPNYDDIRKHVGFKNVDLNNVGSIKEDYYDFIAAEEQQLFRDMFCKADQLLTGLHELIGHGSGKLLREVETDEFNFDCAATMHPLTGEPVSTWYKKGQTYDTVFGGKASALEECRAECVSLYLNTQKEVQQIFGFLTAEQESQSIYIGWLSMVWRGLKALEYYNIESGTWGSAHAEARFAIFKTLVESDSGILSLQWNAQRDDVHLVMNEGLIATVGRELVGKLLLTIHVAKSTADASVLSAFWPDATDVSAYLELHALVMARRRPRNVFVQSVSVHDPESDTIRLQNFAATPEGFIASVLARDLVTQ